MRINHNLASLNTYRQLATNGANTSKSLEKLSSGLRINKAGDDAAGLAISEKMRGQIRGLDQAGRNAQDGISLIQTAEGALNETHSILQRMRELAVQSATDTNTSDDRTKIQSEVNELAKEITRISNTTEFNTQNLLAGGLDNRFHVGSNAGQYMDLSVNAMDAKSLGVAGNITTTSFAGGELAKTGITSATTESEGLNSLYILAKKTAASAGAVTDGTIGAGLLTDNASTYTGSTNKTFTVRFEAVAANEVTSLNYSTDGGTTWTAATNTATGRFDLSDGVHIDINANASNTVGDQGTIAFTAEKVEFVLSSAIGSAHAGGTDIGSIVTVYNNQSSVQIGDAATDKTITLNFNFASVQAAIGGAWADADSTQITQTPDVSTEAVIGAGGTVTTEADTKAGINVKTQTKANLAISTINNAITTVSAERSKLGAMQNRLEHTIANLGTTSENLTASESRVRDVDMAKEMMEFTKNNILSQAAQAMLAQANQQPQGVLQLLR